MWSVTSKYLQASRTSRTVVVTATHRNPATKALTILDVADGTVTEDATATVRRTLTLTLPPQQATWDALSVPGGEITVTKAIRYIDGKTETVPKGVFVVDQDQMGYAPGDSIQLTAPDRSLKIQRNRFGIVRSSVPGNTAWQEIQRLVEAVWASGPDAFPGWSQLDTTATTKVGPIVWTDGDRWKAVTDICTGYSLEMYFDAVGKAVLRPVPILTTNSKPVWTVDAGSNGVQIGASRTRDRSSVRNAVIVTSSATDVHLAPQEVKNTDPTDPLSTVGPLGYVPAYLDSPVLRSTAAMTAAGKTALRRQLGVAQQITLEAAPNDALEAEDVILVVLAQIDRTTPRPTELHMIDSVTTPLTAAGTQSMQTRSTRPPSDSEGST